MPQHRSCRKPVTLAVVWDSAETLIFDHGDTTVAQVSRYLHHASYQVDPEEIAEALDYLAAEDNWGIKRVDDEVHYYFLEDSTECMNIYLEKDGQFWEISLYDRTVYLSEGRVGTLGHHHTISYDSNRFAFLQLRRDFNDRMATGYVAAEDIRPDWTARRHFWPYLNEQPLQILLFYPYSDTQQKPYRYCTLQPREVDCVDILTRPGFDALSHTLADKEAAVGATGWLCHADLRSVQLIYGPNRKLMLHRNEFASSDDFLMYVRLLVSK